MIFQCLPTIVMRGKIFLDKISQRQNIRQTKKSSDKISVDKIYRRESIRQTKKTVTKNKRQNIPRQKNIRNQNIVQLNISNNMRCFQKTKKGIHADLLFIFKFQIPYLNKG